MDVWAADLVGDVPPCLAAHVRQPGQFTLRHLIAVLQRKVGRVDSAEAAAYEEAAREAFQAGTLLEAPNPGSSAESLRAPADRPLGSVAGRTRSQGERSATRPAGRESGSTSETLESQAEARIEGAAEDPLPIWNAREVAKPATDLLRTPRSVTPVADDFFDGLIRRVERDR